MHDPSTKPALRHAIHESLRRSLGDRLSDEARASLADALADGPLSIDEANQQILRGARQLGR